MEFKLEVVFELVPGQGGLCLSFVSSKLSGTENGKIRFENGQSEMNLCFSPHSQAELEEWFSQAEPDETSLWVFELFGKHPEKATTP